MLFEVGALTVPFAREGSISTFIFSSYQNIAALDISLEPKTRNSSDASAPYIAYLSEILSLLNLRDMHLDGGDFSGQNGVEKRYRGVSVGSWINYDTVRALKVRLVYLIDEVALVV